MSECVSYAGGEGCGARKLCFPLFLSSGLKVEGGNMFVKRLCVCAGRGGWPEFPMLRVSQFMDEPLSECVSYADGEGAG